jgi:hypothetical protein
MASKYFHLIEVTPEAKAFVDRSFQIADQIRHVLREKGWTQRDLAAALGKKEPEISRMLIGTHNFTLKTLTGSKWLWCSLITTPQRVHEQAISVTMQGAITDRTQVLDLKKMVTMFKGTVGSPGPPWQFPKLKKRPATRPLFLCMRYTSLSL